RVSSADTMRGGGRPTIARRRVGHRRGGAHATAAPRLRSTMAADMVAWHPPSARSRPVPIGSRSIGGRLPPAGPQPVASQQSPLPLRQSPTTVTQSRSAEGNQTRCQIHPSDALQLAILVPVTNRSFISTFARRVTFLYCADIIRSHAQDQPQDVEG